MIDPFVILAPILLLPVVALLQFVGCSFSGTGSTTTATPTFDPPQGFFGTELMVTLACETDGAIIHYTTDGTAPTIPATGSTQTSSGQMQTIQISTTTRIRAIASAPGFSNSTEADGTYIIIEVSGQRAKGQFDNAFSASVPFPNAVTANNLLVAAGTVWANQGGATIDISDTLGTVYTVRSFVSSSDGNYRVFIAYGRALSSGLNMVTATAVPATAGEDAYCSWGIDEFSGVDTSMPLDTDGGGLSGGPDMTPTASLTTTVANALIVGTMNFQVVGVVSIDPGSGYMLIAEEEDNNVHQSFNAQFRLVTTPGTHSVNWTVGASTVWDLYRVSFRLAP